MIKLAVSRDFHAYEEINKNRYLLFKKVFLCEMKRKELLSTQVIIQFANIFIMGSNITLVIRSRSK